jgi:hypothetical protein
MSGIIWGGTKGYRNCNKIRKQKRKNSTPGRDKGERCVASSLDRYFAKKSRAYKHKNYNDWLEKTHRFNNC